MKISLSWIKEYIDIDVSPIEVSDALTSLGLECNIISDRLTFTDVVLGKIESYSSHPNSDHLNICSVNIGSEENLSIICGASNLDENIFVACAKIGSTLDNGKFKIKKAKLRDVDSFGMLCSEKELNISNNHEGILIINNTLENSLGKPIEDVLDLSNDIILEIDLTPNRGDCLSHLGVARELALFFNKTIKKREFTLKENKNVKINDFIKISNNAPNFCPRYSCRMVKNIKVKESPLWLRKKIESIGQKSINNIVDAANFVMHDYGHPMHTFDYNKILSKEIEIRTAKNGEEIITLDSQKRKLKHEQLLICDGDKNIALAGVMGSFDSEITNSTKDVLIECAYFDPIKIRQGSKKVDLSTESSKRFERDTDIENMINALNNLTSIIAELGDGEIVSGIIDIYSKVKEKKLIDFNLDNCNSFLGTSLSSEESNKIFINLNFKKIKNKWEIPFYRNDIIREVDLYEEIARVYGYDNIPTSNSFSSSFSAIVEDDQKIKNNLRMILSAKGFNEHYSNSLYNISVLEDFNSNKTSEIINESSKDMKYLRNSLLPGLLNAISFNEKRGQNFLKLFEIGRVHSLIKNYNKEQDNLAMVWFGEQKDHWKSNLKSDIFYAKGEIISILQNFKINNINFKVNDSKFSELNIDIFSKKKYLGFIRLLDNNLKKKYNVNGTLIYSELSLTEINKSKNNDVYYSKPSSFPLVRRDISLLVKTKVSSQDLINCIFKVSDKLLIEANVFDMYIGKELGKNLKSIAIALIFQSSEKTLVDKDVDNRLSLILDKIKSKFRAIQR